jgi:hypothetical protein
MHFCIANAMQLNFVRMRASARPSLTTTDAHLCFPRTHRTVPSLYSALPPPVAASRVMAFTTLEDVLAVKQTLALWSSSCACSCTVARVASLSSRTCSTITSYGSTSSYRPVSDIFREYAQGGGERYGEEGKKDKKILVQNFRTSRALNPVPWVPP